MAPLIEIARAATSRGKNEALDVFFAMLVVDPTSPFTPNATECFLRGCLVF